MIASSTPTVAKSRIAQERVSRKSGRSAGLRRRRCAMSACWEAWFNPCSTMSTITTDARPDSSPTSRVTRAVEASAPSSMSQAKVCSTLDLSAGSASSCARAAAPSRSNRSRPKKVASGRVSAKRLASRVLPLPSGPMIKFNRRTSRSSNRSPPQGQGRSKATVSSAVGPSRCVSSLAVGDLPRARPARRSRTFSTTPASWWIWLSSAA
jgi:hypothetical protein